MSSIEDIKGTRPVFLPEQFFDGKIEVWAVVEGLLGGLQKRATITGEGHSAGAGSRYGLFPSILMQ